MGAALIIVFREMLEAGLIVGIVLAATAGIEGRLRWIWGAIGAGVIGAGIIALFAGQIAGSLSGQGQEYFNAAVLLAAVLMLGWHHLWMADHGRDLARQLKKMGSDIHAGQASLLAMAGVVALAILREGSEVVLFLYGAFAASDETLAAKLIGVAGGVVLGGAVSWLLYRGLLAIPVKRLFQVTGVLLTLLAAGLAAQAAAILAGIGVLPTLIDQVWDTSAVLRDDTLIGRTLHVLVGYSDRPTGVQLLVYVLTLAVFAVAGKLVQRAHSPRPTPSTL